MDSELQTRTMNADSASSADALRASTFPGAGGDHLEQLAGDLLQRVLAWLTVEEQNVAYACSAPRRAGALSDAYARMPQVDIRTVGVRLGEWDQDWDEAVDSAWMRDLTRFLGAAFRRKDDASVTRVEAGGVDRVDDAVLALMAPKLKRGAKVCVQACRCVTQHGINLLESIARGVCVDARWCWQVLHMSGHDVAPAGVVVQLILAAQHVAATTPSASAVVAEWVVPQSLHVARIVGACTCCDGPDHVVLNERLSHAVNRALYANEREMLRRPGMIVWFNYLFGTLGHTIKAVDAFTVWRNDRDAIEGQGECVRLCVRLVYVVRGPGDVGMMTRARSDSGGDDTFRTLADGRTARHARLHVLCRQVKFPHVRPVWSVVAMHPERRSHHYHQRAGAPGPVLVSCTLPRPELRNRELHLGFRYSESEVVDGMEGLW